MIDFPELNGFLLDLQKMYKFKLINCVKHEQSNITPMTMVGVSTSFYTYNQPNIFFNIEISNIPLVNNMIDFIASYNGFYTSNLTRKYNPYDKISISLTLQMIDYFTSKYRMLDSKEIDSHKFMDKDFTDRNYNITLQCKSCGLVVSADSKERNIIYSIETLTCNELILKNIL